MFLVIKVVDVNKFFIKVYNSIIVSCNHIIKSQHLKKNKKKYKCF